MASVKSLTSDPSVGFMSLYLRENVRIDEFPNFKRSLELYHAAVARLEDHEDNKRGWKATRTSCYGETNTADIIVLREPVRRPWYSLHQCLDENCPVHPEQTRTTSKHMKLAGKTRTVDIAEDGENFLCSHLRATLDIHQFPIYKRSIQLYNKYKECVSRENTPDGRIQKVRQSVRQTLNQDGSRSVEQREEPSSGGENKIDNHSASMKNSFKAPAARGRPSNILDVLEKKWRDLSSKQVHVTEILQKYDFLFDPECNRQNGSAASPSLSTPQSSSVPSPSSGLCYQTDIQRIDNSQPQSPVDNKLIQADWTGFAANRPWTNNVSKLNYSCNNGVQATDAPSGEDVKTPLYDEQDDTCTPNNEHQIKTEDNASRPQNGSGQVWQNQHLYPNVYSGTGTSAANTYGYLNTSTGHANVYSSYATPVFPGMGMLFRGQSPYYNNFYYNRGATGSSNWNINTGFVPNRQPPYVCNNYQSWYTNNYSRPFYPPAQMPTNAYAYPGNQWQYSSINYGTQGNVNSQGQSLFQPSFRDDGYNQRSNDSQDNFGNSPSSSGSHRSSPCYSNTRSPHPPSSPCSSYTRSPYPPSSPISDRFRQSRSSDSGQYCQTRTECPSSSSSRYHRPRTPSPDEHKSRMKSQDSLRRLYSATRVSDRRSKSPSSDNARHSRSLTRRSRHRSESSDRHRSTHKRKHSKPRRDRTDSRSKHSHHSVKDHVSKERDEKDPHKKHQSSTKRNA